jgi:hypothetical protein
MPVAAVAQGLCALRRDCLQARANFRRQTSRSIPRRHKKTPRDFTFASSFLQPLFSG